MLKKTVWGQSGLDGENNSEGDEEEDEEEEGQDDLDWFVVLVSFTPPKLTPSTGSSFELEKRTNPKNRTFIYGSWAPLDVLNRMNASGEENIHTAATKACDASLSYTHTDYPIDAITNPIMPTMYGIICILGPIKGQKMTKFIVTLWESMSRGQHPRTITGYMLANRYHLEFTINLPLFFQLDPNEVRIDVHEYSMTSGVDMSVTPLTENLNFSAINTRKARTPTTRKRLVAPSVRRPPAKRKNL